MLATVADFINVMELIAPRKLAEDWDNVGLQVGQLDWEVKTVWIALDPLPEVVSAACKAGIDLIITHHPLIFRPLTSIDCNTPVGSIIQLAIRHRTAIFSAHTNLDSATDGLNDILANRIELQDLSVLQKAKIAGEIHKLVFWVPIENEDEVIDTILRMKTSERGCYKHGLLRTAGKATIRPESSAIQPTGEGGDIADSDQIRIETVVKQNELKKVIEQVCAKHSLEKKAVEIYPLTNLFSNQGIGRVGVLANKTNLQSLVLKIKARLGLSSIKFAGKPDLNVRKIAVCTGSGSSLMRSFFSSGADVYISGDLHYHDARAAQDAGLGLIDIGHFASEHLIVESLTKRLQHAMIEAGMDVIVEACEIEKDPFIILS
jgi:dinuclear metal center YbgI/SA1388 family protein